jgi:hypothetical protein
MNLDNIDLVALQRDLEEFAREQQQRGWWRRNWLWFVPTLLVVLVLLGGGGAYWALFTRVYQLDVYQSAMQKVASDGAVRRVLGSPVTTATWPPPSARVEAGETDVRWPIEGPDGRAKAHVLAKLMQGKWETIQLEVILADEKRLLITSDDESEADAPTFVAPPKTKPQTQDAAPNMPAPEINLAPPTDDGPPK